MDEARIVRISQFNGNGGWARSNLDDPHARGCELEPREIKEHICRARRLPEAVLELICECIDFGYRFETLQSRVEIEPNNGLRNVVGGNESDNSRSRR